MCFTKILRVSIFLLALQFYSIPLHAQTHLVTIVIPNAPDCLWIISINPFQGLNGPIFHETRKLHLWWSSVDTATGYNIYRGEKPGFEGNKPIARNIHGTDYVDTHLKDGATYYYRFTAVNKAGESAQSPEAFGTTRSAPKLHDARVEIMPWEDGVIRTDARLRVDADIDWTPASGDLSYNWTVPGKAPGKVEFDPKQNRSNGVERYWSIRQVRFSAPGIYKFRVTATDKEGLSGSAELSVAVKPVVTSLKLSPENTVLIYNESRKFKITAKDQFEHDISQPEGITWTTSSSAATVNPSSGIVTAANFYPGNGDAVVNITVATPDNKLHTSTPIRVLDRGPIITSPASIIPCDNSYTPMPKSKPLKSTSKPVLITTSHVKFSVSAAHDSGIDHIHYRWEIIKSPDGANMNLASFEQSPGYLFIKDGDYTFRVTIGDQNGKSVSRIIDVTAKIKNDGMCAMDGLFSKVTVLLDEYSLTAQIDKAIPEGKPALLKLELKNTGDTPVAIGGGAYENSSFKIIVFDSLGKIVKRTHYGDVLLTPPSAVFWNPIITISPHQTKEYTYDLARMFNTSRPGEYSVSVSRSLPSMAAIRGSYQEIDTDTLSIKPIKYRMLSNSASASEQAPTNRKL